MAKKVKVQSGQTLSSIAKANNTTVDAIKEANPKLVENPKYNSGNTLFSGTTVVIPAAKPAAPAAPRVTTDAASEALRRLTGGQTLTESDRILLGLANQVAAAGGSPVDTGDSGPIAGDGKILGSEGTGTVGQGEDLTDSDLATKFYFTDPDTGKQYAFNTAEELNAYVISWSAGAANRASAAAAKVAADAAAKVAADAAAAKAAEKQATKQKASDKLTALFKSYGLDTLAPFINEQIMADVSEEMLMLKLYDRTEYKTKFPGMAKLRTKGRTITESEYLDIEKQMVQTARFFDLPSGFYDSSDDFGTLIGNEVSAKEYQDRLQVGQDLARSLNPGVKKALLDLYEVGEGGITAYVLDSDKALSVIQKQAKASQFVGLAKASGFGLTGMTAAGAEAIAGSEPYAKLSEQQLQQQLGQAGELRRTQARLAGIEGQKYNEQEALNAVIVGSPEALLASQQRAARETARFSARSGLTDVSLRSSSLI